MSVSKSPTATCAYCNGPRAIHDSVEGSYCSQICYDKHQGRKLLNTVYHSHVYCALCGTRLKDIEPPKPDWAFDETNAAWDHTDDGDVTLTWFSQEESRRSAIGFEYTTDKADTGFKTAYQTDHSYAVTSGIVCGECGNASLQSPQEDIRHSKLFEYVSTIIDSLEERKADGEFDCEIDTQTVFHVLTHIPDLELAIGIARQ